MARILLKRRLARYIATDLAGVPETFRRGLYLRRDSGRGRVTLGKSDPQDYQPVCVVFPKPSEKELEWMERFPTRPDVVVLPNTSL